MEIATTFISILLFGFIGLMFYNAAKNQEIKKAKSFESHYPLIFPNGEKEELSASGHHIVYGHEYVDVHVAGVTFRNGMRTRQAILRAIKWHDAPYDGNVHVSIKKVEFEGSDAFEVWANDEQIGYVPKELIPFFSENWNRYSSSCCLKAHGGGKDQDGMKRNYGANFYAKFRA